MTEIETKVFGRDTLLGKVYFMLKSKQKGWGELANNTGVSKMTRTAAKVVANDFDQLVEIIEKEMK